MKTLAGSNLNSRLDQAPLSALDKGIPFGFQFTPDFASKLRLNILDEALHFPLLLLKESALSHNIAAMAEWCAKNNFLIAPHGKTTMSPRIFERQIEAGAWAITVATASQAAVCAKMGVKRILIANQVVGRANVASLAAIMKSYPAVDLLCLVDSPAGIELLSSAWQATGADRPIGVLLEMGHLQWRTGARTLQAALQLSTEVLKHPQALAFRGIEGFEGIAHAPESDEESRQVKDFLGTLETFGKTLRSHSPSLSEPLLCSVGGSAFLDVVWEFGQLMQGHFQIVLRSGCYVTHDHGYYAQKLAAARKRGDGAANIPQFRPALELWSHVQSMPEEGLAILSFGKRDCSYDIEMPIPIFARSPIDPERRIGLKDTTITHCNDQHAFLRGPSIQHLKIGDQVCCGISHPCTAFDKWRALPLVDDSYNLIDIYRTYF